MPKVIINGHETEVENGLTVMQACQSKGIEIPHFCYHPQLSIAGNCRMCLVEVKGAPKPVASCAMPIAEGMEIMTDTDKVRRARKGVMEFLLINHPLDCPICDQGGECDLQDQAMAYGRSEGRYCEAKRAVEEKNMGPLIKTHMTRCIHCTRCVRFMREVAGVKELGALGRGEDMEITNATELALTSELTGNIVDLCPVGALTSKPYAYKARPWELVKTESIDIMDALGSNIRIDHRDGNILRILPRENADINEQWLSDKSRYAFDGLKNRRLDRPYIRQQGRLVESSFDEALELVAERMRAVPSRKIAAIAGDMTDCETMSTMGDLMAALGSPNMDCRQHSIHVDVNNRASYLFNSGVAGLDKADALVIIGSNPRIESPVLNARIRKRYLQGGFDIAVIGEHEDLTYPYTHLGNSTDDIEKLAGGTGDFAHILEKAENPMIIVGAGALCRQDGEAILAKCHQMTQRFNMVKEGWNGFNVLHNAASTVGGIDVGFVPGKHGLNTAEIIEGVGKGIIDIVFLLGADEIPARKLKDAFVVYIGHHGDVGAHQANVILPGAAYSEKNVTYVNTEGRPQRCYRAVFPPGQAKTDWKIIRKLAEISGVELPYNITQQCYDHMIVKAPILAKTGHVVAPEWEPFGTDGKLDSQTPVMGIYDNFFVNDAISRASATMAELRKAHALAKGGHTHD